MIEMEEKKSDALSRAQELMAMPGNLVPQQAIDYAIELYMDTAPIPRDVTEIIFPAMVHYAQMEENLPCPDPQYIVGEKEKQLFAKIKG